MPAGTTRPTKRSSSVSPPIDPSPKVTSVESSPRLAQLEVAETRALTFAVNERVRQHHADVRRQTAEHLGVERERHRRGGPERVAGGAASVGRVTVVAVDAVDHRGAEAAAAREAGGRDARGEHAVLEVLEDEEREVLGGPRRLAAIAVGRGAHERGLAEVVDVSVAEMRTSCRRPERLRTITRCRPPVSTAVYLMEPSGSPEKLADSLEAFLARLVPSG